MAEKVLMKGNEAIAEAAIQAGCRHYFGYPITPQTEIAAYMAKRMPKIGGTFLQAESEIAAINMVIGAASAGVRVMTSSSSPGISLKCEGLSYMAGCDLPALVVNVQRGGPGLGGIQPSQSDYFQATRGSGHGDFRMIVLAPASVQEMASLTVRAFDLADTYRMTSMILADGTMGQMMEPVELNVGEVAKHEKPWAATGTGMKRPHNIINSLSLVAEELEALNFKRYEKYKTVAEKETMYEEFNCRPRLEECGYRGTRAGNQGRHDPSDHAVAVPERAYRGGSVEGQSFPVRRAFHGTDDRGCAPCLGVQPSGIPLQPRGRYDPVVGRG